MGDKIARYKAWQMNGVLGVSITEVGKEEA
jgi:hypothetical protein